MIFRSHKKEGEEYKVGRERGTHFFGRVQIAAAANGRGRESSFSRLVPFRGKEERREGGECDASKQPFQVRQGREEEELVVVQDTHTEVGKERREWGVPTVKVKWSFPSLSSSSFSPSLHELCTLSIPL